MLIIIYFYRTFAVHEQLNAVYTDRRKKSANDTKSETRIYWHHVPSHPRIHNRMQI